MRAVIIAGGQASGYAYLRGLIEPEDTIICADSGYDLALKLGVEPDIVIGDFDSIKTHPPLHKTLRFPAKKDFTDTELAVSCAREQGHRRFLILGGIGTRMDHTLTNIFMLQDMLSRGEEGEIVNEYNRILITDSTKKISTPEGTVVSLLPLARCINVTTQGLEYPLTNETLEVGSGRGISNVVMASSAQVSLHSGKLLVVFSQDEPKQPNNPTAV